MKFQECQHVLSDGNTCRAPRLRNAQFCYFHVATRDRIQRQKRAADRKLPLQVPVLEDPWTVQLALGDVVNALLSDRIDYKKAALALYALQTASANMRNLGSRRPESYGEYVPELQASLPEEDLSSEDVRVPHPCGEPTRWEGDPAGTPTATLDEASNRQPSIAETEAIENASAEVALKKHRQGRTKIPPKKPVASVKPPQYRTVLDKFRDLEVAAKKEEIWAVKQYTQAYKEGRCEPLLWAIEDATTVEQKVKEDRDFIDTEMAALRNRMKNNRSRKRA